MVKSCVETTAMSEAVGVLAQKARREELEKSDDGIDRGNGEKEVQGQARNKIVGAVRYAATSEIERTNL